MSQELYAIAELVSATKRLGGFEVLRELNLAIGAGEVTALLGPNGAGKTTAVGLLTGRLQPDGGTATLFGLDPSRPAARARMGVMLQASGLPDTLTIQELVTLQSGHYRDARPVAETLGIAGLCDLAKRRCGSLSGGQTRRVQYALAICGRPDLLVLDEPTAAMDQMSRHSLWDSVREAAASGAGVLLTSHDLAEADALADRVLVMDGGRIVADDSPAALRARVGGSVVRCRTGLPLVRLRVMPAVRDAIREGAETRIATTDAVATIRALADADRTLADLRVADASLEDAIAVLLTTPERIAA